MVELDNRDASVEHFVDPVGSGHENANHLANNVEVLLAKHAIVIWATLRQKAELAARMGLLQQSGQAWTAQSSTSLPQPGQKSHPAIPRAELDKSAILPTLSSNKSLQKFVPAASLVIRQKCHPTEIQLCHPQLRKLHLDGRNPTLPPPFSEPDQKLFCKPTLVTRPEIPSLHLPFKTRVEITFCRPSQNSYGARKFLFFFILLNFYNCIVPLEFLPWEIQVSFPRESQLQQNCATQPTMHAGCFTVSIIQRTLTWTTGSLTCAHMLMHAIAHRGVRTP